MVTTAELWDLEALTRAFHDAYERRAGEFNYETRGWTRWEDVPPENQALMRAVVEEATRPLRSRMEQLEQVVEAVKQLPRRWELNDPPPPPGVYSASLEGATRWHVDSLLAALEQEEA